MGKVPLIQKNRQDQAKGKAVNGLDSQGIERA